MPVYLEAIVIQIYSIRSSNRNEAELMKFGHPFQRDCQPHLSIGISRGGLGVQIPNAVNFRFAIVLDTLQQSNMAMVLICPIDIY